MKVTKNDLHDLKEPNQSLDEVVRSILIAGLIYLVFIFTLPLSYYYASGTQIDPRHVGILAVITGSSIVLSRRRVVLLLQYKHIYQMRKQATQITIPFVFLFLAVNVLMAYIPSLRAVSTGPSALTPFFITSFDAILFGVTLALYGNVFDPKRLPALCLQQAIESRTPQEKMIWIRNAFRHLEERASEFDLDLNSSEFLRHFAISLMEHKNIDSDLERISKQLIAGEPPFIILNELNARTEYSYLSAKRKGKQRVNHFFEAVNKYTPLLGLIISLLVTILTFMRLMPR